MHVTVIDPGNLAGAAVEASIARSFAIGLYEWSRVIDLGDDFPVNVVLTKVVSTAAWFSGSGLFAVNPDYFTKYFDQIPDYLPGSPIKVSAPEYVGVHELGHEIWGDDFATLVVKTASGGLVFTGPHASALWGSPPPVTDDGEKAHLSHGNDSLRDDPMSGIGHVALAPVMPSAMDVAVAMDLGRSPAKPNDDALVTLYFATFDRMPDAAGLAYWHQRATEGMSLGDIAKSFFAQDETVRFYPPGQTPAQFIDQAYHNVLARAPDPAGAAYWLEQLRTDHVERAAIVQALIAGAQGTPDWQHLEHSAEAYAVSLIGVTLA